MENSHLYIITGSINAGKTMFCIRFVNDVRHRKIDVAGVLSPPVICRKRKIAIEVEDIRSGEKRTLAQQQAHDEPGPQIGHWFFYEDALQWGNDILRRSVPCDVLIVDELGPLELLRHEGWQAGVKAIDSRQYRVGLVVIRPSLLQEAKKRWRGAQVILLNPWIRNIQGWLWNQKLLLELETQLTEKPTSSV